MSPRQTTRLLLRGFPRPVLAGKHVDPVGRDGGAPDQVHLGGEAGWLPAEMGRAVPATGVEPVCPRAVPFKGTVSTVPPHRPGHLRRWGSATEEGLRGACSRQRGRRRRRAERRPQLTPPALGVSAATAVGDQDPLDHVGQHRLPGPSGETHGDHRRACRPSAPKRAVGSPPSWGTAKPRRHQTQATGLTRRGSAPHGRRPGCSPSAPSWRRALTGTLPRPPGVRRHPSG